MKELTIQEKTKRYDEALDNNLLNIEYQDSEIIVLTFFGDIDNCFYYGGFVIDKNYDILKASCNITEKRTGKRHPVQFITKADGCNLCDLFGIVPYGKDKMLSLLLPKTFLLDRMPNACCWVNDIVVPFRKGELYEYAPLHRAHITTEDYIANILADINMEKTLNNQLRCAETIKIGLDNVANSVGNVANALTAIYWKI
jgi:hypothetical protein